MSVMPTGQGSKEVNEVVQIDHQKICMTDSGYNQDLVMIDHFTKYAEAVPCITASAEETCDHLINTWIARRITEQPSWENLRKSSCDVHRWLRPTPRHTIPRRMAYWKGKIER